MSTIPWKWSGEWWCRSTFLDLGTGWKWSVSITHSSCSTLLKGPLVAIDSGAVWAPETVLMPWNEKNLSFLLEIGSHLSSPKTGHRGYCPSPCSSVGIAKGCKLDNRGFPSRDKMSRVWSWPLTAIQCKVQEAVLCNMLKKCSMVFPAV